MNKIILHLLQTEEVSNFVIEIIPEGVRLVRSPFAWDGGKTGMGLLYLF